MTPLIEQALLAIYHGQQEHAWSQVFVEHVEGALEQAGLYRRLDRPPAMCFLDLTGYTRLTEERGDEAAADLAARLAGLVRRSCQEHGGTPVKWLGDGVMFYFREPEMPCWPPWRWWSWSGARAFHRRTWGSTRGRWSSRTVTTSAGP